MAKKQIVALSPEEYKLFASMLRDWRQRNQRTSNRPHVPEEQGQTSQVFLARAPTSGIDKLARAIDDQSSAAGSTQDVPGVTDCSIYRVLSIDQTQLDNDTVQPAFTGNAQRTYNFTDTPIRPNQWMSLVRDRFGRFLAMPQVPVWDEILITKSACEPESIAPYTGTGTNPINEDSKIDLFKKNNVAQGTVLRYIIKDNRWLEDRGDGACRAVRAYPWIEESEDNHIDIVKGSICLGHLIDLLPFSAGGEIKLITVLSSSTVRINSVDPSGIQSGQTTTLTGITGTIADLLNDQEFTVTVTGSTSFTISLTGTADSFLGLTGTGGTFEVRSSIPLYSIIGPCGKCQATSSECCPLRPLLTPPDPDDFLSSTVPYVNMTVDLGGCDDNEALFRGLYPIGGTYPLKNGSSDGELLWTYTKLDIEVPMGEEGGPQFTQAYYYIHCNIFGTWEAGVKINHGSVFDDPDLTYYIDAEGDYQVTGSTQEIAQMQFAFTAADINCGADVDGVETSPLFLITPRDDLRFNWNFQLYPYDPTGGTADACNPQFCVAPGDPPGCTIDCDGSSHLLAGCNCACGGPVSCAGGTVSCDNEDDQTATGSISFTD